MLNAYDDIQKYWKEELNKDEPCKPNNEDCNFSAHILSTIKGV